MNTSERLSQYYEFDEAVLQSVGDVAEQQNKSSFKELADQHEIGAGPERTVPVAGRNLPIEFIHLKPKVDYDESRLRVYRTPMGIPVDDSTAMRAMRLFASDPTVPLMVFGNPSVIGNRSNLLNHNERLLAAKGDLRPGIRPVLSYLMGQSVDKVEVLGYSFGADAGAAIGSASTEFGIKTEKAVLMEPAGVSKRSIGQLLKAFKSSDAALQGYVDQADSPPLMEARNSDASAIESTISFVRWAGGLMRASNISIARGLGQGTLVNRLEEALHNNDQLRVALIWGSESEMVDIPAIKEASISLSREHSNRFKAMEINGMHHGGGDDIDLHAAMALQGLALSR